MSKESEDKTKGDSKLNEEEEATGEVGIGTKEKAEGEDKGKDPDETASPEKEQEMFQDPEKTSLMGLAAFDDLLNSASDEAKEAVEEMKKKFEEHTEKTKEKKAKADELEEACKEEEKEIAAGMEVDRGVVIKTAHNNVQACAGESATYSGKDAVNVFAQRASWLMGRSAFFYAGSLKGVGDWFTSDEVDEKTGEAKGGVAHLNKIFSLKKSNWANSPTTRHAAFLPLP